MALLCGTRHRMFIECSCWSSYGHSPGRHHEGLMLFFCGKYVNAMSSTHSLVPSESCFVHVSPPLKSPLFLLFCQHPLPTPDFDGKNIYIRLRTAFKKIIKTFVRGFFCVFACCTMCLCSRACVNIPESNGRKTIHRKDRREERVHARETEY